MCVYCAVIIIAGTYALIGITASIIINICRMVQGLADNTESRGTETYITKTFQPPIQYPLVAIITGFYFC